MTKDEMWAALVERHPEFADEEHVARLRVRGLRRLLDQAWDEGHTKGLANGRALEVMDRDRKNTSAASNPFGDIFEKFGISK